LNFDDDDDDDDIKKTKLKEEGQLCYDYHYNYVLYYQNPFSKLQERQNSVSTPNWKHPWDYIGKLTHPLTHSHTYKLHTHTQSPGTTIVNWEATVVLVLLLLISLHTNRTDRTGREGRRDGGREGRMGGEGREGGRGRGREEQRLCIQD